MRVAIDTNALYTTRAGISRYVRKLLQALRRHKPECLEITEIGWPVENFDFRQPQRALKTLYRELLWARLPAHRILRKIAPDVYHSTGNLLTLAPSPIPQVVTVHDMAVFRNPERFRPWHRFSARAGCLRLHKVEHLICISQFTIQEVREVLGLPIHKISLVYYGSPFHPEEGIPKEKKPNDDVSSEFFLFVSSLEPGKNVRLIREAYQLAESKQINLPPLLLAGTRFPGVAHEGPPPQNWRFLGHQTDEALVYLYRRALALLFPSKYEGFGLPVVEAQALGCPVICSRVASLPEVGGEAAYYSEMTPAAYLEAMLRLMRDGPLRRELVEKGKAHSAKFSWSKCARETMEVYRHVIKG